MMMTGLVFMEWKSCVGEPSGTEKSFVILDMEEHTIAMTELTLNVSPVRWQ